MATTKTTTKSKAKTGTREKKPDIRKQIKNLLETIEQSWFEISILLSDTYYGELYKKWGYESFEDYAKAELDMEYRSAMFRVQVGKTINDLNITKQQIGELGWTKFKELTYILKEKDLTKEHMENLFNEVKDMSFRETKEFIKQVRIEQETGEPGQSVKKTVMKFKFTNEQEEVVQHAVDEAMGIMEVDNENLALEYICMEWMMNHSETPIAEVEDEPEEVKPKRKEKADVERKRKK